MTSISVRRPKAPIRAVIDLPRSKSISNRALICAALAGDLTCVKDLSHADDTRILYDLLTERPRVMHCGLGGTTFRFLLAWAAVQEAEEHVITGDARLLERPHDDLLRALRSLGGDIERTNEGYRVRGRKLKGGEVVLDSPISSQFISALMMIAPTMREGLRIAWKGRRLSEPYVHMTAHLMQHFGAKVNGQEDVVAIAPGSYSSNVLVVPPDWSAAAFWYEIVGLAQDAEVELSDVREGQWQGDEAIEEFTGWCVDPAENERGTILRSKKKDMPTQAPIALGEVPDLFLPLVGLFAGKGRDMRFTELEGLVFKESDRLAGMTDALSSLGCSVSNADGRFNLSGSIQEGTPPPFDPRGDHRMAMALAPLALVCDVITILDPDVVSKSYPKYWDDLERAGFVLERS
jgi:3-phosphoshikimate 1-carboxyvinyltransferase